MIAAEGVQKSSKALKEAADNRPTDLTGKLLLGIRNAQSGWSSRSNKVTNLNIFSSLLSIERMENMTSSVEESGEEGDYLAWREAQWTLHGEATMEEVEKDELCEEEAWLLFYSAKFISLDDCMHHCGQLFR